MVYTSLVVFVANGREYVASYLTRMDLLPVFDVLIYIEEAFWVYVDIHSANKTHLPLLDFVGFVKTSLLCCFC